MKRLCTFLLLCFLTHSVLAQTFMRANEWKKYKKEVFFTFGISNFLGDLGGRDKQGSDYTPLDLNFNQSKLAIGIGGRYKLERWLNVAGKFSYLRVSGDDAATNDVYRHNRNLNFKSNIFELTGRLEAGYQSSRRSSNKYGIRRNYGRMRNITHNLFFFIGIGGFYYNPYGRGPDGKMVALRPLHTEGQTLAGGPSEYSNFSVCIPVGAYYKVSINKMWSIGIEFCYRKTFTDYIDDVGSRYFDKTKLAAQPGIGALSAYMSDPNLGQIYGFSAPAADGTPAQRGDKQKDAYLSLEFTLSYTFKKARKAARLRSKF